MKLRQGVLELISQDEFARRADLAISGCCHV